MADVQVRYLTEDEVTEKFVRLQWRLTHAECMAFVDAVRRHPQVATAFVNERIAHKAVTDDDFVQMLRDLPAHTRGAGEA